MTAYTREDKAQPSAAGEFIPVSADGKGVPMRKAADQPPTSRRLAPMTGVGARLLAVAKKRGYLAASVGGEEAPICGDVFGRKAPERKGRSAALSMW